MTEAATVQHEDENEDPHEAECPCHQCAAARTYNAVYERWFDLYAGPLAREYHHNMIVAGQMDEACSCGEYHLQNATDSALVDIVTTLISNLGGGTPEDPDHAAALELLGRIMTNLADFMKTRNVPETVTEDIPAQNAPTTPTKQ